MKQFLGRIKDISVKQWLLIVGVLVLGMVLAFGLRFWLVKPPVPTHYHANFALYINGKQDEFKDFTFYEEVQACSVQGSNDPRTRIHMHNQKNYEVHVHDTAATWGHFFANLSYGLTDKLVQTGDGVYINGQGGKLSFILNGQPVTDVANRTVGDDDVLLIDYGNDSSEVLKNRYDKIPRSADELDKGTDPASCTGSKKETLGERAKRTVGIE